MPNRVLLDTNIIADLFDNTRQSSKTSIQTVQELLERGTVLYVNSDTLTTTFYLLRNQKKTTWKEAIHAIKEISILCELISIETQDVLYTIALCQDNNTEFKDYEDALQYVCAKKVDVALILTNDKGFVSKDLKCMTSKTFVETFITL